MADIEEGTPEETSEASEGSRVPPSKHQVNPEPPEDVPQELKAPATAKGDWVGTTGSLNTSDFDATNLCLPSKSGTFWAFLLASAFTFLALLAYGFAERTFFSVFWRQLLRLIGWELMVYVPVMCLVQPILRNYLFYNLQPSQSLADAWPLCEGVNASTQWFRKLLVPCLQHLLVTAIMATLTFLEFNQKYLGMLAFSCSASPLVLLLVVLLLRVLGPPVTAKSYAFSLLPFVATWTIGIFDAFFLRSSGLGSSRKIPLLLNPYVQLVKFHTLGSGSLPSNIRTCPDVRLHGAQTVWRCLDSWKKYDFCWRFRQQMRMKWWFLDIFVGRLPQVKASFSIVSIVFLLSGLAFWCQDSSAFMSALEQYHVSWLFRVPHILG